MEIELLQQFNSLLLCAHTVHRGRLLQEGDLNIWEQEETSDSKPTAVFGMNTHAIDLLEVKKKDLACFMWSLVMVGVQTSSFDAISHSPSVLLEWYKGKKGKLLPEHLALHSHFPMPPHTPYGNVERVLFESKIEINHSTYVYIFYL